MNENSNIYSNTKSNIDLEKINHNFSFSDNNLNIIQINNNISSSTKQIPNNINENISKNKKLSSFKMIEKIKYNKKKLSVFNDFENKKREEEAMTGRERRDAFGNVIKRKNKKKIKISFVDEINQEQPLVSVIDIESYKKYNLIIGIPKEDNIQHNNVASNCQCCAVF